MPRCLTSGVPYSVAWGPGPCADAGMVQGPCRGAHGAQDGGLAVLAFNGIDGLVEADGLLRVFIKFDLVVAGDQAGEANADQADEQAAVVQFFKEGLGNG